MSEDGMRGYFRIFTQMSESYLSLILSHEEMNKASLVELVLYVLQRRSHCVVASQQATHGMEAYLYAIQAVSLYVVCSPG